MAKKKKGSKHAAVKSVARKAYRRASAGLDTKPGKVLLAAGMAAAGGVVTSYAINNIPKVKDLSQNVKSGAQLAVGVAAIFFGRKKWIKSLGAGAVVAGVFGAVKSLSGINPLAGPSAGGQTLPAWQMQRLLNGRSMSAPVSSIRMSAPANVSMRGGAKGFGGVSF